MSAKLQVATTNALGEDIKNKKRDGQRDRRMDGRTDGRLTDLGMKSIYPIFLRKSGYNNDRSLTRRNLT